MFTPKWGRRETVIFPPHQPIYTIAWFVCALIITVAVLVEHIGMGLSPLAEVYLPLYVKTGLIAAVIPDKEIPARLITLAGQRPRLALPGDVVAGSTPQEVGKPLPLDLAQSARKAGFLAVVRGPQGRFSVAPLHLYLRLAIYRERGFRELCTPPLRACLILFLAILPYSLYRDIKRAKRMKYGRLLKGPIMCDPERFIKSIKGDGIGFKVAERWWTRLVRVLLRSKTPVIRVPQQAEAKHFLIMADTGAGKTQLMFNMLLQIQERDEGAIIYDPAQEFTERFYNPERGDIILNPLDARCPYWGPAEELRRRAEARTLAASLFQNVNDQKKGEFFVESPQKIFAHLLTFGPTPAELAHWMANEEEIDKRVEGTEYALLIKPNAPNQRTGVLSSLGMVAESLRMLPKKDEAKRQWNATEWSKERKGWIFITSEAAVREALRPLHSLWIDWLVLRLLVKPREDQRPVWFIIDELASLQKLPQLHTALTENRKSKNPIVLGFQGKAQLEVIYGHLAEVMLSQPATKIFLKTEEEKAALWVSKTLGDTEIERVKLAHHEGGHSGKNYAIDRQIDPAVMYSEIQGLPDLHAYLKYANHIVRFSFPYLDMAIKQDGIIPRPVPSDELNFDPTKQPPKGGVPVVASVLTATARPQAVDVPIVDPGTSVSEMAKALAAELAAGEVSIAPGYDLSVSTKDTAPLFATLPFVIPVAESVPLSAPLRIDTIFSEPRQVLLPEESTDPDPDLEAGEATPPTDHSKTTLAIF